MFDSIDNVPDRLEPGPEDATYPGLYNQDEYLIAGVRTHEQAQEIARRYNEFPQLIEALELLLARGTGNCSARMTARKALASATGQPNPYA